VYTHINIAIRTLFDRKQVSYSNAAFHSYFSACFVEIKRHVSLLRRKVRNFGMTFDPNKQKKVVRWDPVRPCRKKIRAKKSYVQLTWLNSSIPYSPCYSTHPYIVRTRVFEAKK